MKRIIILTSCLFLNFTFIFSQFEDISMEFTWGETYLAQDSVVEQETYKEILLNLSNIDTLMINQIQLELLDSETNTILFRYIEKKPYLESFSLNLTASNQMQLFLGYYSVNRDYKLVLRFTNYQGLESETSQLILLKE